ncbi:MAG: hypothetical protein J3R72DRAFT_464227 [Linnemannia gamsii]|nr:MAG: hypothetical protein J3R72DRAFT_464227 [Linnemannia gamsii]
MFSLFFPSFLLLLLSSCPSSLTPLLSSTLLSLPTHAHTRLSFSTLLHLQSTFIALYVLTRNFLTDTHSCCPFTPSYALTFLRAHSLTYTHKQANHSPRYAEILPSVTLLSHTVSKQPPKHKKTVLSSLPHYDKTTHSSKTTIGNRILLFS